MITDYGNGELLIKEHGWNYPVRIYETCRATIGFMQKQARQLLRQALQD